MGKINIMKFTLNKAKRGQQLLVQQLPEGDYKLQLIRFGILEGETITCLDKIFGGTIIIQKNRLEIALGNDLARQIIVSSLN